MINKDFYGLADNVFIIQRGKMSLKLCVNFNKNLNK